MHELIGAGGCVNQVPFLGTAKRPDLESNGTEEDLPGHLDPLRMAQYCLPTKAKRPWAFIVILGAGKAPWAAS